VRKVPFNVCHEFVVQGGMHNNSIFIEHEVIIWPTSRMLMTDSIEQHPADCLFFHFSWFLLLSLSLLCFVQRWTCSLAPDNYL
jgi:hypothetical protein